MSSLTSFALCAVHHFIANAIYRCRTWDLPSRITVTISDLDGYAAACKISVADTGPGICGTKLQEIYPLRVNSNLSEFFSATLNQSSPSWDGVVSLTTTGIQEEKIRRYKISFGDEERSEILELPPDPKAQITFSGSEVTIHVDGPAEHLVFYIRHLCEKISILQLSNIYLELCLEHFRDSSRFQHNETQIIHAPVILQDASVLERLCMGTIEYISRYVYKYSCGSQQDILFRKKVKFGKGQERQHEMVTKWILHSCVIAHESEDIDQQLSCDSDTSCLRMEIFFFESFCFNPLPMTWLSALQRNVDWAKFGLEVKSMQRDALGITRIDFEHSSSLKHITTTIHRYEINRNGEMGARSQKKQLKYAIEAALNELKKTMPHQFLGAKVKKMQQCVPDLSKCLAGLITTSMDSFFKRECCNILNLPFDEIHTIEDHINEKMLSVIHSLDFSKKMKYEDGRKNVELEEDVAEYCSDNKSKE